MNDEKFTSETFIPILKSRLEAGLGVNLTVTGNSMLPFLVHKRDSVYLSAIAEKPKKGDIILFVRPDGKCVLHRVKKVIKDGVYFVGDGQTETEGPVPYDALLAICRAVTRKGKIIDEKSFTWFFFKKIWLNMIPLRFPVIAVMTRLRKH